VGGVEVGGGEGVEVGGGVEEDIVIDQSYLN